jgi:hypothetical protein
MNAFGGDPQRIIDLLERKPITAQFPIRRVRLSSTSFHGTSNSTPRKDSLVPRSAETARTLSSTGTLLAIATFRPTFLVSRAKKVWTPENQRYPAQASTKPAVQRSRRFHLSGVSFLRSYWLILRSVAVRSSGVAETSTAQIFHCGVIWRVRIGWSLAGTSLWGRDRPRGSG